MRGGSGNQPGWRTAVPHGLSLQRDSSFAIPHSHHSSDGESDPGPLHATGRHVHISPSSVPYTADGHFRHRSGQASGHTDPLTSDQFEDTPYVPPRPPPSVSPQTYQHTEPHATHTYDPSGYHDTVSQQQYSHDCGKTSPSDSLHSGESNYSTNSSSSSDYRVSRHNFYVPHHAQSAVQYITQHPPLPRPVSSQQAYQHHYPAYHGHHRVGLEHIRYADQQSMLPGTQFPRVSLQEFSLDNILAPEVFEDPQPRIGTPSEMVHASSAQSASSSMLSAHRQASHITYSAASSMPGEARPSLFPDAGPYLRQQLGLGPHEPVSLWSLPDPPPGEKPNQPYPMLIKLAIYGSTNKQLTLQDIYNELEKRFAWFREHRNERAWKNSIRHNLSLNKVFRHVPRPITEPGKGSYWQLDISGGEGYKRPRKRRTRTSKATPSDDDDDDMSEVDEETDGHNPLETRPQSSHAGSSQYSSPSSSQGMALNSSRSAVDDTNIDPELRVGGSHVVGEGRTRPGSRRLDSPYPSNAPPAQHTQNAPVSFSTSVLAAAPEVGPLDQFSQFGQSSFGQPSFSMPPLGQRVGQAVGPTMHQTRSVPIVPQPISHARFEYAREQGGMPTTRRIRGYTVPTQSESQGLNQSQTHARVRTSQESATSTGSMSSSGSSQSWSAPSSANMKGKRRAM